MPADFSQLQKTQSVNSFCPDCGTLSNFVFRDHQQGREIGFIEAKFDHVFEGTQFARVLYTVSACVVCRRPGVLKSHANESFLTGKQEWFWPTGVAAANLPRELPMDLKSEFREAERCANNDAWRGAAALLRSTLEKTLKANGYRDGSLYDKLELAGTEGLITAARKQSAHDVIRTLGNDVLHEDWRVVTPDEVASSFLFVQRILEDFYFSRATVEATLNAKNRL